MEATCQEWDESDVVSPVLLPGMSMLLPRTEGEECHCLQWRVGLKAVSWTRLCKRTLTSHFLRKLLPSLFSQRLTHPSLSNFPVLVKLACFLPLPSSPSSPVTVLHFAPIVHLPLDLTGHFSQAFSTGKVAHLHGAPRCARCLHACHRLNGASPPLPWCPHLAPGTYDHITLRSLGNGEDGDRSPPIGCSLAGK